MRVALDMDGVCVDWFKGMCKFCGKDGRNFPKGRYDLTDEYFGTPWSEVKKKLTPSWWAGLDKTEECEELIQSIQDLGVDLCFLTSQSDSASASGKVLWCEKHYPSIPLVMTKHKAIVAKPSLILVDDYWDNVVTYRQAGGRAVGFPRPWNHFFNQEWRVVLTELEILIYG